MPSFTRFLKDQKHRLDAVGRFAQKYVYDENVDKPTKFPSYSLLVRYIHTCKWDDVTRRDAAIAWKEWNHAKAKRH